MHVFPTPDSPSNTILQLNTLLSDIFRNKTIIISY